ncbi:cytochrome b5 domain-containing protein [Candidatus Woesearchaeota archaeon]|nr:MAG: cytochrome b5 domain-containing protein [Candidatus Woesearchaeota archaeon]
MDYRPVIAGGVFIFAVVLAMLPHPTPHSQDASAQTASVEQQLKSVQLTQEEVQTHDSATSCWTIINGEVYDITAYIPRHPGGRAKILRVCGTDGTELFTTKAGRVHSKNAHRILQEYALGPLGGSREIAVQGGTSQGKVQGASKKKEDRHRERYREEDEDEWDD